jgi:hypothetical protein
MENEATEPNGTMGSAAPREPAKPQNPSKNKGWPGGGGGGARPWPSGAWDEESGVGLGPWVLGCVKATLLSRTGSRYTYFSSILQTIYDTR